MRTIVVGTRKSELALTQTQAVVAQLEQICKEKNLPYRFELKKIVTRGDRILDVTLSKVGGKGLFVKEIEQAMLDGEVDMAVHSMKDVPSALQPGLTLAATTEREDPRDCLVSADGKKLDELPQGATIGTSSLRRTSRLKAYRPDLNILFDSGNIGTRIAKTEQEGLDGGILAAAGLKRVGWEERISDYLSTDISLPAVGQGALGIECRENDEEVLQLLQHINDPRTSKAVRAERTLLHALNGGCQVPIAAYAVLKDNPDAEGDEIEMSAMVGSPDGTELIRRTLHGSDPEQLGLEMARLLLKEGADRLLKEAGVELP